MVRERPVPWTRRAFIRASGALGSAVLAARARNAEAIAQANAAVSGRDPAVVATDEVYWRTIQRAFVVDRKLINLTSTVGWAWDCCSLQIQNVTFKAGLRNENRILFAFTLKGIGTFGTENIGQRRRR